METVENCFHEVEEREGKRGSVQIVFNECVDLPPDNSHTPPVFWTESFFVKLESTFTDQPDNVTRKDRKLGVVLRHTP